MCLAVPACVTEMVGDEIARIRLGEGETFMDVSTMLLEEAPKIGDYVIVHAGFILRILDPIEAQESLNLLREVAQMGEVVPF